MKKIALSVLIITALIVTLKCSDNPVDNDETVEFVGVFTTTKLPCLTQPCLPGGAVCAIEYESRAYIPTINGKINCPQTWNGYTISYGDTVVCRGKVMEKTDLANRPYIVIEIESLYLVIIRTN